jgi:hypothetical protein
LNRKLKLVIQEELDEKELKRTRSMFQSIVYRIGALVFGGKKRKVSETTRGSSNYIVVDWLFFNKNRQKLVFCLKVWKQETFFKYLNQNKKKVKQKKSEWQKGD